MQNFEKQIDEILAKLTLREKIGQLNQQETPVAANAEAFKEQVRKGEIGSILMSVGATAGNDAQGTISVDFYNELQKIAVEESPSGIPILFGRDVIHGHKTVFPIPLAMTASFNEELVSKSYSDIAKEASNDSVHWTFTPMLDRSVDPRWGRIIEGPGEDPYLGSAVARAVVKGLQGENPSEDGKMLACAKHYIGYGASESGIDYHRTEISDYTLNNYYLPAFKSAIDAGCMTVMSSFNDVSGQPVTSSKPYLTEILRDRLNFNGFVVSDYDAVAQLIRQGVAGNDADCAKMSINAGLDMDMHDKLYLDNLENLVKEGKVTVDTIDEAVRRVLRVKFIKGLFDNPYCDKKEIDIEKHRADAREMAAESAVLLKNNGVLPIDKSESVALLGPFIYERRTLLGSWMLDGSAEETPNIYEAIKAKSKGSIEAVNGVDLSWDSAVKWANLCDVTVLCLGESWTSTGEHRAVSNISLSSDQLDLIKRARAAGKKVVGVLFCGRPVEMEGVADNLDALIYAWHGGSEVANAVADIIYGDTVPSGKLPMTIPRKATHIPIYYNITSSGRPVNNYYGENAGECYVDSIPTPYYPFGYGLSYTEFKYSDIECKNSELPLDDIKNGKGFTLCVDVENIGKFDGKEVVELYIHDNLASMMRPIKELKGFKKVLIKKGETAKVEFSLGYNELGFYLANGDYVVEPGEFTVYIGENSLTERKITIKIKG
ncbi:MAG: glycoside hydrolase family 3 C-terminal domain-containing protein [Clostridia bacterium]|nr:glycoside hydrolase family 3 C-terminal domain-containing protein [Clostridia bacterium]